MPSPRRPPRVCTLTGCSWRAPALTAPVRRWRRPSRARCSTPCPSFGTRACARPLTCQHRPDPQRVRARVSVCPGWSPCQKTSTSPAAPTCAHCTRPRAAPARCPPRATPPTLWWRWMCPVISRRSTGSDVVWRCCACWIHEGRGGEEVAQTFHALLLVFCAPVTFAKGQQMMLNAALLRSASCCVPAAALAPPLTVHCAPDDSGSLTTTSTHDNEPVPDDWPAWQCRT